MKLTKKDFENSLQSNSLAICLIGMSGMGKSYRSNQLTKLGFNHICCDNLIANNISDVLPTHDVEGLASWMKQPYSKHYQARESLYLQLENKVSLEALSAIEGNTVLDTTGSFVHLSKTTQNKAKQQTLVVYLEASQETLNQMFEVFLANPKPLVWSNVFNQQQDESSLQALKRCYPKLLETRSKKYEGLADVTLPYHVARSQTSSATEFLEAIKQHL